MENTQIAIIVLLLFNALVVLLAWQFDRHLYIPFLQKMKMEPEWQPEYNPHLLRLGLVVLGCGLICYAVIGWLWLMIS